MIVTLFTPDGKSYTLPAPLRWKIIRTSGVPADSAELAFVADLSFLPRFDDAARVSVTENGAAIYTGTVDETYAENSASGTILSLSSRGGAAALLDSRSVRCEYENVTLTQIIERHVKPYGIAVSPLPALKAATRYTVECGTSQWSALSQFTNIYGITPRFSADGRLVISKVMPAAPKMQINGATCLSVYVMRRRYGRIAQVTICDYNDGSLTKYENSAAKKVGITATRVRLADRSKEYERKALAQAIFEQGEKDTSLIRVTVPGAPAVSPADTVSVYNLAGGLNGRFITDTTEYEGSNHGIMTVLKLVRV